MKWGEDLDLVSYWSLPGVAALAVLYGTMEYQVMSALGYSREKLKFISVGTCLVTAVLGLFWCARAFPLPVLYALAYLVRALRYLTAGGNRTKTVFLLNLGYVNHLVINLAFIGGAALLRGETMRALLLSPGWRTASLTAAAAVILAEDLLFLKIRGFSSALAAEAESEEAGPFMAFLWFCTGYLLVDSLLCAAELEPFYTPLFLIGSSGILIFILALFLRHLHSILQRNHLKDEHERLSAELAERDRSTGALRELADRDALTGVYSRRYAMERLRALAESGEGFALAFLDLDRLKEVNDQEGHDAGDRYLVQFTQSLSAKLRGGDLLARLGGDEFVVLMPGCTPEAARRRMETIRGSLAEADPRHPFGFSFGVSCLPPGAAAETEELLREADGAMYRDKADRH